jgi:hypothetical protein
MRRLSVLKASRWVMVVGGGIASPGTRTAQGEVYAATDLAPGAGDTATGEAGRAEVGAEENQSQQKQSQSHPLRAFGVCETAESSAAIPEPVSPVSRQSHETGAGNSADPVVPAALSGEALIAAALRQLGLKGGK